MIGEKDIEYVTCWNFGKSNEFGLDLIAEAMRYYLDTNDITDISIEKDSISGGSIFKPYKIDALKFFNPAHMSDYYYFCMTIDNNYDSDTVNLLIGGKSKQLKKEEMLDRSIFDGAITKTVGLGVLKGGSFGAGMAIGGVTTGLAKAGVRGIKKGIAALTRDEKAIDEERYWYSKVLTIADSVFCSE